MLVMTPEARMMLRKERRRERDAIRGRLGEGRFDILVAELARVIRLAFEAGDTGTLFGLEGPLRAGIRSDLCRQGWGWDRADMAARDLLDEAFRTVHAIRPSWDEGQPEWVTHAGTLIERTRCARHGCGKPLPEGHYKFCCRLCQLAHNSSVSRLKEASADNVVELATRRL